MLPYDHPELFQSDSVAKDLTITYSGGTLTNSELLYESFEMDDSLCSGEQVEFGECISTMVKFDVCVDDVWTSLEGEEITITITPEDGDSVPLGVFKVTSDVPSADLKVRSITAYDAMSEILNAELVTWYDGLFPNEGDTVTLLQFRNSLFTYLGITQESVSLINDSVVIEKTISTTSLSGKDVLNCICQMNGVFGKIGRDGKFKYVSLEPIGGSLYPAETLYPKTDLYPQISVPVERLPNGSYIDCTYENYVTDYIDKVQIRMEENDIGVIVGSGTNAFIIQSNFLLFGKSSADLTPIAQAIYDKVSVISFQPIQATLIGNPLREVGDGIRIVTTYQTINTYVLRRKLTGIQSLRDYVVAESPKERSENITDTHHELMMLMGKANILERTIEQTQSTIVNVAGGLQTQITQNANAITAKASKEDGDAQEFAYKLTSEKFELIANENVVFRCNKNGISVIGSTGTTVLNAASAEIGTVKTTTLKLLTGYDTYETVNHTFGVTTESKNVITGGVLTYKADLGGYIITGSPSVQTISYLKYQYNASMKVLTIGNL